MKQPAAGIVATIAIVAISLGFIAIFSFPVFSGWVAYLIDCIIPMQVVVGVTWAAQYPKFAALRSQPTKGLLLLLLTVGVGSILAISLWLTVGHGVNPPTPILIFFVIDLVLTTFGLTIMWGGWPFTSTIKNPIVGGIAILITAVLLSYAIFIAFFDFSFLQTAPFYSPMWDPHGLFNAWNALVYYVTLIAAMFFIVGFDLWPLHKFSATRKQPVLGLAWTALSALLAALVFYLGTGIAKMDVVDFMVNVPIPYIFGTIIVLNMLQGSLFRDVEPPLKGVLTVVVIAAVGALLAQIYGALAPMITGRLSRGGPGFDFEIWLASAMLSVTFPLLVFYSGYFNLWPLRKGQ